MRFSAILTFAAGLLAAGLAPGAEPRTEEISALVRKLGSEEYQVREKATEALRAIGPAARSALEKAVENPDAEIRERASRLLREIIWKLPPALTARLGGFADRFEEYTEANQELKLQLLSGLRSRAPREAEAYILQAAREQKGAGAQSWLCSLLTIYRSTEAERRVLRISRMEDRQCREAAADALARAESRAAEKRLLELLGDPEPTVRRAALEAIARRGPLARAHFAKVAELFADADETVRSAAARAAGRLGDQGALTALWKLAGDPQVAVRVAAISAIGRLSPRDEEQIAKRLAEMLDDPLPAIRGTVLSALQEARALSAAPSLGRLLSDGDTELAAAAASTLAIIGDRSQFAALRKAAGSTDESLAASSAAALIAMGDREFLPKVAGILRGRSAVAASVLARALGETGDPQWIPELLRAAEHWKSERFDLTVLEIRSSQYRDPDAFGPLLGRLASRGGRLSSAMLLSRHALYPEAEKALSSELTASLDNPSALLHLGIAQIMAGRAGEGMDKLKAAARMDPLSATILNNCAWFLLTAPEAGVREPARALAMARRAARLAPRTGYILDTYAWALHRNGKSRQALEAIDAALGWVRPDHHGESAVLAVHRARILAALGRRKEASAVLAKVIKRHTRDPELALEAARAYCDLGNPEKACEQARRAVLLGFPDITVLRKDPELAVARQSAGFPKVLEAAEAELGRLREVFKRAAAASGRDPPGVPLPEIILR
jgi:HEAT repeat protein